MGRFKTPRRRRRRTTRGRYRKGARLPTRRRLRFPRTRSLNPRRSTGLPQRMLANHSFCDTIRLNPGAGSAALYQYRANSVFDPDKTGAGHQPYLHDQLAAQYSNYKVVGSTISCRFTIGNHLAAGTGSNCIVGIDLSSSSTMYTTHLAMMEHGTTVWRSMPGSNTTTNTCGLKRSYKLSRFTPAAGERRDDFGGTAVGADPTLSAYFNIYAWGQNVQDNPGFVDCCIKIVYHVLWSHGKHIGLDLLP